VVKSELGMILFYGGSLELRLLLKVGWLFRDLLTAGLLG
jgi:hypothetical protein